MSDTVVVTRDGKPLTGPLSEQDAFAWLLHHQPMSIDWAIENEGYAFQPVEVEDFPEFPRLCAHGITETTDVRCTLCLAEESN